MDRNGDKIVSITPTFLLNKTVHYDYMTFKILIAQSFALSGRLDSITATYQIFFVWTQAVFFCCGFKGAFHKITVQYEQYQTN